MTDATLADSFFERHRHKIAFAGPDQCWLWTAYRFTAGYGGVKTNGKRRQAHRVAYEAAHGEGSAEGLVVRHRCDTPLCVNPGHLLVGTFADNSRDMVERGRHVAVKGEANGRSKLTEADVLALRSLYVRGQPGCGGVDLARRYGVGQSQISDIVHRRTWKHVA